MYYWIVAALLAANCEQTIRLELPKRIELLTSSLPWKRSTD